MALAVAEALLAAVVRAGASSGVVSAVAVALAHDLGGMPPQQAAAAAVSPESGLPAKKRKRRRRRRRHTPADDLDLDSCVVPFAVATDSSDMVDAPEPFPVAARVLAALPPGEASTSALVSSAPQLSLGVLELMRSAEVALRDFDEPSERAVRAAAQSEHERLAAAFLARSSALG